MHLYIHFHQMCDGKICIGSETDTATSWRQLFIHQELELCSVLPTTACLRFSLLSCWSKWEGKRKVANKGHVLPIRLWQPIRDIYYTVLCLFFFCVLRWLFVAVSEDIFFNGSSDFIFFPIGQILVGWRT